MQRVFLGAFCSALLTLTVLLAVSGQVYAYDFGNCQYDDDVIDPITYTYNNVGDTYRNAFDGGADNWNDTSAPGEFDHEQSASSPEIVVRARWYSLAWTAYTSGFCDDGLWRYDKVTVELNTFYMDWYSASKKEKVVVHELGHAYGLAHVFAGCVAMRETVGQIENCDPLPAADDINGVVALYP